MEDNNTNMRFNCADGGFAYTLTSLLPYFLSFLVTLVFSAVGEIGGTTHTFVLLFAAQFAQLLIIFLLLKKKNAGLKPINLKKFDYKYIFLIIGLSYGMIFCLGYLNELFISFIKSAGGSYNDVTVPHYGAFQIVLSYMVLAVLPPIFEECIFRGVMLSGLSGMKTVCKVLLIGGLFALYHQNPAQTVYPFITGCIFALITVKSGSTLPAIIMHFINNVFVVTAACFFPEVQFYNLFTIISGGIIFAVSFAFLLLAKQKQPKQTEYSLKEFFVFASFGIAVNAILWVVALV